MGLWGESGDDWSGKHFHAKEKCNSATNVINTASVT